MRSLERCKETLAEGVAIQVMPEGTRSRNGQLAPFKKGGFHMAMDVGAEIAPFGFRGLYEYSKTGSWLIRPTKIEVVFTPPVDTHEYTKETINDLVARVRGQIEGVLEGQTDALPALQAETSPSH
jgi:1-acyl-sn-glycerol-3-phosphate acyltransferase